MISPSPDWFSGFYDFNTLDPSTNTWFREFAIATYPMDAGTEVGNEYSGENVAEDPKGPITRFTIASPRSTGVFLTSDESDILPVARWQCTLLNTFVEPTDPVSPSTIDFPAVPISLVATAVFAGFDTLVESVRLSGLDTALSGGIFTIFAPTDEAFAALPAGALEVLLQIENQSLLQQVLQYHVAEGETLSGDLTNGDEIATLLDGESLSVAISGGTVTINGVAIVGPADVVALNGVIHVIDTVLLPPGFSLPAPSCGKQTFAICTGNAECCSNRCIPLASGDRICRSAPKTSKQKLSTGTTGVLSGVRGGAGGAKRGGGRKLVRGSK
jgi:hypothetical protein